MLLSLVTGGYYVGLMSLLGVFKLHAELARQTAHYQHAWRSHQAWCMTRKSQRRDLGWPTSTSDKFWCCSVLFWFKQRPHRNWVFGCLTYSWRALDADSMRVCVCPSWRMSSAEAAWQACSAARGLRGLNPAEALTHTLWPWALSHIHTMRLRCLGLDLGPRALGSHTPNQHSSPASDSELVLLVVFRVAGRSIAPSSSSSFLSPSASPFLKYEDPWRYLISYCWRTLRMKPLGVISKQYLN